MDLIESLQWRYATKRMNGEKIEPEKINRILECIRLSASSLGFQPYTIYVVESNEWKEKISKKACTQPQVLECSHFLIFAAWTQAGIDEIDKYFQNIATTRQVSLESLADFKKAVVQAVTSKNPDEMYQWASKQCYLALGTGLVACAVERVDSTPMEGFDADTMGEVLGLKNQKAAVCMAIGKRNEKEDYLVNAKKVRRKKEELFIWL